VTISVGVASRIVQAGASSPDLRKAADFALYAAKATGPARVQEEIAED